MRKRTDNELAWLLFVFFSLSQVGVLIAMMIPNPFL